MGMEWGAHFDGLVACMFGVLSSQQYVFGS